jgi:hypothetical protein
LRRGASMARCFGLEVRTLTPPRSSACGRWSTCGCDRRVFLPKDGQTNPVDTTQALAKGARAAARASSRTCRSRAVLGRAAARPASPRPGARSRPSTSCSAPACGRASSPPPAASRAAARGRAFLRRHRADPRPVARSAGAARPRRPRLFQGGRRQAAGRLVRAETAKPWGMEGIPERLLLRPAAGGLEHIEPLLERAVRRVPALAKTGIQLFFNGPESFTPDDRYLLGEAPELRNLFVAAGFNSIGIQSSGGAGKVLADWIVDGHPPMDLWDVDIRRVMPFQRNRATCASAPSRRWACSTHALAVPQPRRARRAALAAARPAGRAPAPASARPPGWERPNWYRAARREAGIRLQLRPAELVRASRRRAPRGARARRRCSTRAPSPSSSSRVRRRAVLNRICANDIAVAAGPRRLHAMAQRARRHRGRPHRHARERAALPRRHRGGDARSATRLAARRSATRRAPRWQSTSPRHTRCWA